MNPVMENLTGMNALTDQVIATDLLIAAKSGIKNYALALTETTSPEVRTILKKQLEEEINSHEQISNYMVQKGWYHPYDVQEQIRLDIENAEKALNLPEER